MHGTLEALVAYQLSKWCEWLPTWRPARYVGRTRLCTKCFASPILAAALLNEVPHAVQHALTMRMKIVIDTIVDAYTKEHLPLLWAELRDAEKRKLLRTYLPSEGLSPEYQGLAVDPEPDPEHPYLFTLEQLASETDADVVRKKSADIVRLPFTQEEKELLRSELRRADENARITGRRVCNELVTYRERISSAVSEHIEPHIEALLTELTRSLEAPTWPS